MPPQLLHKPRMKKKNASGPETTSEGSEAPGGEQLSPAAANHGKKQPLARLSLSLSCKPIASRMYTGHI